MPDHVAVPVVDAPTVTTMLPWPRSAHSPAIAALVRTAAELPDTGRDRSPSGIV